MSDLFSDLLSLTAFYVEKLRLLIKLERIHCLIVKLIVCNIILLSDLKKEDVGFQPVFGVLINYQPGASGMLKH